MTRLRNRWMHGCCSCPRLVFPYEGFVYRHDADNPPPSRAPVFRLRARKARRGKPARTAAVYVVRCQPCALRYDAEQHLAYAAAMHPDPWWAA